ncbi:Serine phosphatase RsbU, regulator of sigma subunit [Ruminococcaceae bacterium YRB3002]|nr:Serine phosphatase RsbU, regulator of sigma subunit [Ruminococcaceae bacterium YRB3002]
MTDYCGNLWMTSTRKGIAKIVPSIFVDVLDRAGVDNRVVNAVCCYGDRVFCGTDTGLVVLDSKGAVDRFPVIRTVMGDGTDIGVDDLIGLMEGVRIRSIVRDKDDRVWFSTWDLMGLACYDHGIVTLFTTEDGLPSMQVRTTCVTSDDRVIVAGPKGVSVIRDNEVVRVYDKSDNIDNTAILCVEEGFNGEILAGSDGGGIYCIKDDNVQHLGKENGLSSQVVMKIKRDDENNVYWIITGSSVAYMTPDLKITTVVNFPYANVLDLYRNSKGDMWVLAGNGIYVASVKELLANEEIHTVFYGIDSGLPGIATANSTSDTDSRGNLYIACKGTISKVNIENNNYVSPPLKLAVSYIEADGVNVYPDPSDGVFHIKAGAKRLVIHAHVFSYSLIDPTVSYRLDGFDAEPVTVSLRDFGELIYTNLRGGTYTFEVDASGSDGMYINSLSVVIEKDKAFYEHAWFYLIIIAVFLAIVGVAVHIYISRRIAKIVLKQKEEAEKERISNELNMAHDIQSSMMPHEFPPFPDHDEFDIYASMDPAREVGGDFYDYYMIDDDHLCITIADVSGKGIPASLFMMIAKTILKNNAMHGQSAEEILIQANDALCAENNVDMFVTVWLGILEISTGKVTAVNGGHEYPAVMRDGRFELLHDKHGFVVGGMEGIRYRSYEFYLKPGDKLFVYTDGVPEASDADKNMFGVERMIDALNKDASATPQEILHNVRAAVDEFVKDAEQFDDLTMLCLEIKM